MDSITSFSKEDCERSIKIEKKSVRSQFLWLIFILCLASFDGQSLLENHSIFGAITFGMILVSVLWTFVLFLESSSDLKDKKLRLKFLTELYEIQRISAHKEAHIKAKHQYDELSKNLKDDYDRLRKQSTPL